MDTPHLRSIVHLDLDAFYVSVERLKDRRLQTIPLIIGGNSDRAVVTSCSYEARQFGVHAAMPVRIARQLCPQAVMIRGDIDAYQRYSQLVTEIIHEDAPLYEKASIDEFFIDLTGMDRFLGCYRWADSLRNKIIKETGLPLSFGLSVNKLVSKMATGQAKPNGKLEIPAQQVLNFLAPLPVGRIPLVGPRTSRELVYMGVRNVATLRMIPRPVLERAFGKTGILLYRRARGEDDSPVIPQQRRQSVSSERTFAVDTTDIRYLHTELTRMTEKLAFQLRNTTKLTACIQIKLRYANFETISRQARIPYTADDTFLIRKALQLFEQLYQKRLLVRLLGVRFSELVSGGVQLNLFEDTPARIDLHRAMGNIRYQYGDKAISRASAW